MSKVRLLKKSPTFAYYDSISAGLVPCKVITHSIDEYGIQRMTVVITAKRGGLKKGHRIETSPIFVVPRSHVVGLRGNNPRVLPYRWTF